MVLQFKENKNGIDQALDQKTPERATEQRQKTRTKQKIGTYKFPGFKTPLLRIKKELSGAMQRNI